jgi:cytochrome b
VSGQVGPDPLVWDPLVRAVHWGMVASVTVAWLVSEGAVHDRAGYILLALVALRIVWGFVGPPHARFADFIRSHHSTLLYVLLVIAGREPRYLGHNPLGGWMIVALLATALATAISGCVVAWVERVHVFFAELLLLLAALHVAGVAFTSIRHRENLVAAMLHGKKRATVVDDAAGAAEQTKVSTGRKP